MCYIYMNSLNILYLSDFIGFFICNTRDWWAKKAAGSSGFYMIGKPNQPRRVATACAS